MVSTADEYNLVIPDPNTSDNFIPPKPSGSIGVHGFDDVCQGEEYCEGGFPDMRGIFVASGPKFKSGNHVVPWIKLVDEYQIFLRVLGLEGKPHNGTMSRVEGMFKEPSTTSTTTSTTSSAKTLTSDLAYSVLIFMSLIYLNRI